ncbi:hypothetical protein ACOLNO_002929 [Vibrio parahaemolyticus]
MSDKKAYSFSLYHVSYDKLWRRKQYKAGIEKARMYASENGYKLVNGDYISKLHDKITRMKSENYSQFEIEKFKTSYQNSTEIESYKEFLSSHKDETERVLLIVDRKRFEVCEETLTVFKEMLKHIDIHTVVDGKTYTESSQIEDLKVSLNKAYEDYILFEEERRMNFTRKL